MDQNQNVNTDSLVGVLAQGYLQLTLAYEDMLEQGEKMLKVCQDDTLDQNEAQEKLKAIVEFRAKLFGHIHKMNDSLEKIKKQIAYNMGAEELSLDQLLSEVPSQSTAELEHALKEQGELLHKIKQVEQEIAKINPNLI